MNYLFRIAAVAPLVLGATGCSKSETAQARGGESTAMRVKVEAVRRDSIPRAVDVVGPLAAVDQVTISSEADGKVSRILADLGDRVKAGQVLIQLDSEKQQYTYEQQQAALARALAQYGAADPQHLPDIEKTPDVQKANAELVQAKQAFDRANELFKRTLSRSRRSTTRDATLQSKQAQLRLRASERQEPARQHPGVGSDDEAGRPRSCATRRSARRSTASSRSGW